MVRAFTHWAISGVPFDSAKPTCEKQAERFWLRMSLKPDPDVTWHNLFVCTLSLAWVRSDTWILFCLTCRSKVCLIKEDLHYLFLGLIIPECCFYLLWLSPRFTKLCFSFVHGSLPSSLRRSWVKMVTTYVNFFCLRSAHIWKHNITQKWFLG